MMLKMNTTIVSCEIAHDNFVRKNHHANVSIESIVSEFQHPLLATQTVVPILHFHPTPDKTNSLVVVAVREII